MREIYRILDANCNRAREALRVVEDCGRFVLNDPALTATAKNLRSDLQEILEYLPADQMITCRDTPGDIGTDLTSSNEPIRKDITDVATAACKRLTEALRTIEEYSKVVAPDATIHVERMRYDAYTVEQRLVGKLHADQRMNETRLYGLISSHLCHGSVLHAARAAIAGGVDVLQLREKQIPDNILLALAAELRELTDEMGKLLIINDRPDIAAMVGADGVHLGQDDLPIAETRRILRPGAIIGRSTHSLAQAHTAMNEGADYIAVGPMFETSTKEAGPIVGPELLAKMTAEIPLPIVPIGGITAERVPILVDAGAKRVAVCSAIFGDDPRKAAEAIKKQLPPIA